MEIVLESKIFWNDVKVQFVVIDGLYHVKFHKRDGAGRWRYTRVCMPVGNLMGLRSGLDLNERLGWTIPADKLLEIKLWIMEVF